MFFSFAICVLTGTQLCCRYCSFSYGTHAAIDVSRPLHNGLVTNKHHESVDIHGQIILHQNYSDWPRCDFASLLRRFLSPSTLSDSENNWRLPAITVMESSSICGSEKELSTERELHLLTQEKFQMSMGHNEDLLRCLVVPHLRKKISWTPFYPELYLVVCLK